LEHEDWGIRGVAVCGGVSPPARTEVEKLVVRNQFGLVPTALLSINFAVDARDCLSSDMLSSLTFIWIHSIMIVCFALKRNMFSTPNTLLLNRPTPL
jgi:hypothetical protein